MLILFDHINTPHLRAMASRSRRGGSGAPRKRPARPHNAAETQAETTPAPETAEEVVAREMEEIRKEVRHLPGI